MWAWPWRLPSGLFRSGSGYLIPERIRLLRRVGEVIAERVYDIAAALSLEVGKNRLEALGEAQETADFFEIYCDDYPEGQF